MDYRELREAVWDANLAVVRHGLVRLTWGNVSGIDRNAGVMAIKPSGVAYDTLRPEDIVLLSLDEGRVIDSSRTPSSDTPTHLCLYRHFAAVNAVVHTHSEHATAWAQLGRSLPCYGTTHADHFYGTVPITRPLTPAEIAERYEEASGKAIVETFEKGGMDPVHVPAAFLPGHAPFTWGPDPRHAVDNAVALESAARMALLMGAAHRDLPELDAKVRDKHFFRKHGANAYYGQARS